jgi:hypothetical protein
MLLDSMRARTQVIRTECQIKQENNLRTKKEPTVKYYHRRFELPSAGANRLSQAGLGLQQVLMSDVYFICMKWLYLNFNLLPFQK